MADVCDTSFQCLTQCVVHLGGPHQECFSRLLIICVFCFGDHSIQWIQLAVSEGHASFYNAGT